MKTRNKLISLVPALILVVFLSACKDMTPTTPSAFETEMESLGYTVTDTKEQFENENNIAIEDMYVASKGSIQVYFMICTSSGQAQDICTSSLEKAKEKDTHIKSTTSINYGNHSKYTLNNGQEYIVFSRIENTFVAIEVDNDNKAEINSVLKTLGY